MGNSGSVVIPAESRTEGDGCSGVDIKPNLTPLAS